MRKKENIITKFDLFIKESVEEDDIDEVERDVFEFLGSLENEDLNGMINDFMRAHTNEDRNEYIEDIILEVGDELSDDEYTWVVKELKKELESHKK
jgi:hypothetical protein